MTYFGMEGKGGNNNIAFLTDASGMNLILDLQRFCRGVPMRSKRLLDAVMVRRHHRADDRKAGPNQSYQQTGRARAGC